MSVTPARRHDLFEHARSSWGADSAETLMELLPPDADQLATQQDVLLTKAELRTEMAELRTEMAEFRTEMRVEMAELRTEMAELRTEVRMELAALRVEMHEGFALMDRRMADQIRMVYLALLTSMLTTIGLSFAAAHFA
jgi:hypothetical protein